MDLDCVQGMPLTNPREEECKNRHKWSEFIVLTYCSAKGGGGDTLGQRASWTPFEDTLCSVSTVVNLPMFYNTSTVALIIGMQYLFDITYLIDHSLFVLRALQYHPLSGCRPPVQCLCPVQDHC